MGAFISLSFFAMFFDLGSVYAQFGTIADPTEDEKAVARKAIGEYEKFTKEDRKIAVIAKVDYSAEDFKKNDAYSKEYTFIKCTDGSGLIRYDAFKPVLSVNTLVERLQVDTMIYDRHGANWFYAGRKSGALAFDEDPAKQEIPTAGEMARLEPLDLPLYGDNVLKPRPPHFKERAPLSGLRITNVQDELRFLAVELCLSEKENFYMRIVFDKALDNRPVEARILFGNNPGIEQALVKTKWTKSVSGFLPTRVTAIHIRGLKKTSFKGTYDISMRWCDSVRDAFGESAFLYDDTALKVNPFDLEKYIIDKATLR